MSGQDQMGDMDALFAANAGELGTNKSYEVTAGGFAEPGAAEEETSASPQITPEPEPQREPEPQPQETKILGRPPEDEPVEDVEPEPSIEDSEAEADYDYDKIIAGLTAATEAERNARQEIQNALQERERELAEAKEFRERYEPHIADLADLWPDIERQSQELKSYEQQKQFLEQKLKMYRDAAAEAGLEVDESRLDLAATLQELKAQQAALPNLIDQRLARVIDSKSETYDRSEQQRQQQAEYQRRLQEHNTFVANKMDEFYKENPSLQEFDNFIRPHVHQDPRVDPRAVAAPFMKFVASRKAKSRAESTDKVNIGRASDAGQVPSASQDAAAQGDMGKDFANMSIDEQIAKLRTSGLFR